MGQSSRLLGVCLAASVTAFAGQALGQTCAAPSQGPDVIVGDLPNTANFTPLGGIDAFSMATTSCNLGTVNLLWNAFPANTHPAITQNMYRWSTVNGTGRFEHIGMSWLKHGFTALTGNVCCTCNNPGSGSLLGVGCSDPYTAARNASQGGLGPHWEVNAYTGFFPTGGPATGTGGSGSVYRRLQFATNAVVATNGGSAATTRFFGESQYVSPDDAAAGNQNNNCSYRELAITGTSADWTVNFSTAPGSVANTSRMNPAIRAWAVCEPGVTLTNVQTPGDGLFIVGSKAYDLGGGMWRYEYAVFNMNCDRNGGTLVIPVPSSATVTNIGFSCPSYHSGDGDGNINFSNAPWTSSRVGNTLVFATETQAANIRANAIRWSTTYNFRFDANVAPVAGGNVSIGLWKSGSPSAVYGLAQSPGQLASPIDGAGSATPSTVQITGSTLLRVTPIPAANPSSTGITVTGDLSNINGSSSQTFYDNGTNGDVTAGDGVFSFLAPIAEPLTAGARSVSFTIADAQGRSSNGTINLTLTAAPSGRCCTGGSCAVLSEYACTTGGGTYYGAGTVCAGPEAPYNGNGTYPAAILDPSQGGIVAVTATVAGSSVTLNNDLVVRVGLNHTYVGDLTATLSKGATNVQLFARPGGGGNGNNLDGIYTFYAGAPATFVSATGTSPAPSGNYTPSGNFASFNGQSLNGTWTLTIQDFVNQDVGQITSFAIGSMTNFACPPACGTSDFNGDGDFGTDADIEAFFACLAGNCCPTCFAGGSDFNGDGDTGTDSDIEAFFRVLGGGAC